MVLGFWRRRMKSPMASFSRRATTSIGPMACRITNGMLFGNRRPEAGGHHAVFAVLGCSQEAPTASPLGRPCVRRSSRTDHAVGCGNCIRGAAGHGLSPSRPEPRGTNRRERPGGDRVGRCARRCGLRLRAAPGRCAHAGSGIGCALAIVSAATALTSLLSSAAAQDGRLCELLDEKIIPSPARWGR